MQHFIRSATENHKKQAWYLKADIANFFVSIDKNILDALLCKHIKDEWWVWLMRQILHKDASKNVHIKSQGSLLSKVPAHKSLLNADKGYGLPIGNLSSQFFANVYLNELDQFAKHSLKLKHYARYVDDIVVISDSGLMLHEAQSAMDAFVKDRLKLRFHPNKTEINTVDHGVNFVGYIIRPHCKYVRRSTIDNMYRRTRQKTDFESFRATVNSYFGVLRNANAYRERVNAAKHFGRTGGWFDGKLTKLVKQGVTQCTSA